MNLVMDAVRYVLLTLLLAGLAGCAQVKPYEREHLARPGMELGRERLADTFEAHAHDAREGAFGASGDSAGGGCGCN